MKSDLEFHIPGPWCATLYSEYFVSHKKDWKMLIKKTLINQCSGWVGLSTGHAAKSRENVCFIDLILTSCIFSCIFFRVKPSSKDIFYWELRTDTYLRQLFQRIPETPADPADLGCVWISREFLSYCVSISSQLEISQECENELEESNALGLIAALNS